jgi:5-methylcytosine-specific restriction enzyme subunit McrC
MSVPVQNIYYLLCYAWDRLESRKLVDVDALPGNRVENLLGKVLQDGVAHLIRRGLDRGYVAFEEETRRLRGKIILSETLGRSLLPRGRVACYVDELSHDVPHNQVIKAAMRALMDVPKLDSGIRSALRDHCRRMHTVTDVELSPAAFRCIQLHRNVARYTFLVNVAQLVSLSFVPDEKTGRRRFRPFTADEQRMGLLFEAFVRNFLRREQDVFHVSKAKVPWDLDPDSSSNPVWLPEMETDVVLTNAQQRITIETKYYATPYQSRHGSKKLISGHLYQLLTYLAHQRADQGPNPTGVLLYASAGKEWRLRYSLGGHTILVRSLDLDRDWKEIHRDLLGLVAKLARNREVRDRSLELADGQLEEAITDAEATNRGHVFDGAAEESQT